VVRFRLLTIACLLAAGSSSTAQVPAGEEFRANQFTPFYQLSPALFMNPDGSFVVAFTAPDSPGYSGEYGVWVKRYDARGAPVGFEARANTYSYDYQGQAAVARQRGGDFVVVWSSYYQDGDLNGIAGQRFDAGGQRVGDEFVVNTYVTGYQEFPHVAALAREGFIVVWRSQWLGGGFEPRVMARVYDASGNPSGDDFQVNPRDGIAQFGSDVASDGAGRFVVVYSNQAGLAGEADIYGQLFDAAGARRGAEFRVNTTTTGSHRAPAVAMVPDGRFVAVWASSADRGVRAQRFSADGARQGAELVVSAATTGYLGYLSVAADDDANFVVAWTNLDGMGGFDGVTARRYDAAGVPRGGEFRVNTYTTGRQMDLKVASDSAGNFVGAWASLEQDGDGDGVYVQRYGGLVPAGLLVDPPSGGGNGVLEPAETAAVQPRWRNVNGSDQSFTGTASQLAGPDGPVYTLVDAAASYGTVADGALGSCAAVADCYAVSLQGARPALHWDATVRERISPDVHGQVKTWRLHVGQSFPDVAAGGLFYPFVETLLHHGVTAGCGGGQFCPAAPTAREQMAVFVLAAKEGAAYAPPACGTPRFTDVPAASPFCPWIEELARRGVVGGCGGRDFCPDQPVTRAQMAVFVLATREAAGYAPPPCLGQPFADVPVASVFCPWIAELARRGVVAGCGGGNYCPGGAVTRGEMGVFLAGAFALALYGP
jgi:hypothetical protein